MAPKLKYIKEEDAASYDEVKRQQRQQKIRIASCGTLLVFGALFVTETAGVKSKKMSPIFMDIYSDDVGDAFPRVHRGQPLIVMLQSQIYFKRPNVFATSYPHQTMTKLKRFEAMERRKKLAGQVIKWIYIYIYKYELENDETLRCSDERKWMA